VGRYIDLLCEVFPGTGGLGPMGHDLLRAFTTKDETDSVPGRMVIDRMIQTALQGDPRLLLCANGVGFHWIAHYVEVQQSHRIEIYDAQNCPLPDTSKSSFSPPYL
jgi:hypothetical protein